LGQGIRVVLGYAFFLVPFFDVRYLLVERMFGNEVSLHLLEVDCPGYLLGFFRVIFDCDAI